MVGLPVYINVLCNIFPNVSKCSKEINQSDHNSLHSEEMENQPAVQASYQGELTLRSMQRLFNWPCLIWIQSQPWGDEERPKYSLPHPTPLLIFLLLLTPKVQISFSPQPSVAIKIKDDSHNFAKKILSTCFPKLHLPCRLMENQQHFFMHTF